MAIITKPKPTALGIPATYWRAIEQSAEFINVGASIRMGGYRDADQRSIGMPLSYYMVSVKKDAYLQAIIKPRASANLYESMFATIYELAMADPFFADGIEG